MGNQKSKAVGGISERSLVAAQKRAAARPGILGEAMSDILIVMFAAMTFVVLLVNLMIYIADTFSKRK